MKLLILVLTTFFALANVSATTAKNSNTNTVQKKQKTVMISTEVSKVLLSEMYLARVAEQNKLVHESGRELKISAISFSQSNIAIHLETKNSADFFGSFQKYGFFVGTVEAVGPEAELSVTSLFFKPADEAPGGASVGN